ncbi:MAG: RidA family protein [Planctomycetota bacterium]|nr:RidA family protein [Planctomycetota bacterium]
MSRREIFHPDKKVSTGHYSAGLIVDGWFYVSGQGPLDMRIGQPVRGTIEEETKLTLDHIDRILREGGCTRKDVVKCTCHLADIKDFDGFNRAYGEYFGDVKPARTTVQSVLWNGIKVEIDAIARVPQGK